MNLQLVYRFILSLSKDEMCFKKKETKQNDQKKGKKSAPARVDPGHLTCETSRYLLRYDN